MKKIVMSICLQILMIINVYAGKDKEPENCTICIEDLDPQDNTKKLITLPCKHEFHDECLASWLKTGVQTCPLCRESVADEKKFIEAFETDNLALFETFLIKYPFLANLIVEPKTKTRILHRAAEKGKVLFVRCLLVHNALVNVENINKETPITLSVRFGYLKTTNLLIMNWAWVNNGDYNNSTPLHEACANGWYIMAQKLIRVGAKIEAITHDASYTPLMLAIKNKHLRTTEFLLQNGADVQAIDFEGKNILKHAKETGNRNIEKLVRYYLGRAPKK